MNYGTYFSMYEIKRHQEEEERRRREEQQRELLKGHSKPAGTTLHSEQPSPPRPDAFNQADPGRRQTHLPTAGPDGEQDWEKRLTSGYDETLHRLDEEEAHDHSPRQKALNALMGALTVYAAAKGHGNPAAAAMDFISQAKAHNDSIRQRREHVQQERQQTLNQEHARREEMQYRADAEQRGYQHDDHMLGARQKGEKELVGIRAEIEKQQQRQQHYDQLDLLQHEQDGRLRISREEQAQRIEAMRLQSGLDVNKAAQITSLESAQARASHWEQLGADPVKSRIVALKVQSGDPLTDEERGFQAEMLQRDGELLARDQARKDLQAIAGRHSQPVKGQNGAPMMDRNQHPVERHLGAGEKLDLLDARTQQLQQQGHPDDEAAVAQLINSGQAVSEAEIDAEAGLTPDAKARLIALLRSRKTAR